jgi:hypothetical protein
MTGSATSNPRLTLGLLALILVVQGVLAASGVLDRPMDGSDPLALLTVAAFGLYSVFIIGFVIGVWLIQPWAWTVGILVAAYGLILAGLRIASGESMEGHLFGMAIDAAILYFLLKPTTRALFGR